MNIKRFFSLYILVISASFLSAQVLIPDPNFEQALIDLGHDTDGVINGQISNADALTVTWLRIDNRNISDLTGIEGFTAMTRLDCYSNDLTTLDVSNNSALTSLWFSDNSLTSIDVSQNIALTSLFCDGNQLTTLNVSNNPALLFLRCGRNQLTTLDVSSNPALRSLECENNELKNLDVSMNTDLELLYCHSNQLTSLDVSNNPVIRELLCFDNQLTTLDVRNGNNNSITSFFSTSNPNLHCILVDDVPFANANWNKDAQATFTTDPNDPACLPPPIPTLSQWAVMILGLIILIVGVVAIRERKVVVA